MRAGFTLVEVVVALLVLEVGILGAVGTLLLASRTLTRAEAVERGVLETESVLDSLERGAFSGPGVRDGEEGATSWALASDGSVRIRYVSRAFGPLVDVSGGVPRLR